MTHSIRLCRLSLASIACLITTELCIAANGSILSPTDKPNFLFILADDLAWTDLACFGHPWHETPHLDALAREGMRFTNAYAAAPICSASRAAILTGKTPACLHFEFVTKYEAGQQKVDRQTPLDAPPFTLNLPLAETTIAESLSQKGYTTAFFGKWHLNAHHQQYLGWSPTHGPLQQGFQAAVEDFGSHPYAWKQSRPEIIQTEGVHSEDSMIDRTCEFLRASHSGPFFVMASQFYVHTPVQTPCRWLIEKYDQRISAQLVNRERRIIYAAFVEELDHRVGKLLTALDEADLRKNTLVVFTSDNGGHPEYTSNGPLRGSKWNLYEGGIRVPMIARWPGHIAGGSKCDSAVIGYDLFPTFAELSDATIPPVDGQSFATLLRREHDGADRELIWHFPYYHPEKGYRVALDSIGVNDFAVSKTHPHSAIRMGRFKLLYFYEDHRYELYDLEADPGEQHDVSNDQPRLAQDLAERLLARLRESRARFPTRNPG